VSAAEGGTLNLEDGATLVVPPGALARDATVTLSRVSCGGVYAASSFASCLYAVSSGGVPWVERYTLTTPTRTSDADTVAVRVAADGLRPLLDAVSHPDSVVTTGGRDGATSAWYAGVIPTDHRVEDAPFAACGGDVVGEWRLTHDSGTREEVTGMSAEGPDPYADCGAYDALVDYPFTVGGVFRFNSDGSFAWQNGFQVWKRTLVTTACQRLVGEACDDRCALEDGVCDCNWDWLSSEGGGDSVWTLSPDGLTLTINGAPTRYCVQGDTLSVQYSASSAHGRVATYERVP